MTVLVRDAPLDYFCRFSRRKARYDLRDMCDGWFRYSASRNIYCASRPGYYANRFICGVSSFSYYANLIISDWSWLIFEEV